MPQWRWQSTAAAERYSRAPGGNPPCDRFHDTGFEVTRSPTWQASEFCSAAMALRSTLREA
jgi:hypothetical protein